MLHIIFIGALINCLSLNNPLITTIIKMNGTTYTFNFDIINCPCLPGSYILQLKWEKQLRGKVKQE